MPSDDTPGPGQANPAGIPFPGLPLSELIGGPLVAAIEAQARMAQSTADFINMIGFVPPATPDGVAQPRTASFAFTRPVADGSDPSGSRLEEVRMDVPLLSIVKVPNLQLENVDITFDIGVTAWKPGAGADQAPAIEAVLAGPNPTLRAPGYAISMKAVSAEPTEAMARVMEELAKAVTPVVKPL